MALQVVILNSTRSQVPSAFLKSWVANCEKHLRQSLPLKKQKLLEGELVLVFKGTSAARKINLQFRNKDYATDVLSFLSPGGFGELVLCPDVLKRQAKAQGHSLKNEMGYMVLHGMLHLLGYDHEESDVQARQMFQIQDQIFRTLTKT